MDYSPWDRKQLDVTERLTFMFMFTIKMTGNKCFPGSRWEN